MRSHPASLLVALVAFACRPSSTLSYVGPPASGDPGVGLGGAGARIAQALEREYRGQVERAPSPVALVPSDGSELQLTALAATVKIEGPVAHTELHFRFHNPEPRQREGRFSVQLPLGASVDRFAMRVGETWREARLVSREQGRQVYESFLHKRVDPALLEYELGNQLAARVYPIDPNSDKHIIVGYEQLVSDARPYVLPLAGLPAIPAIAITLDHDGVQRTEQRGGALPQDFVVPIASGDGAIAAGDGFVARIDLPAGATQPAPLERVLVLVDTSASRAPVMGRQIEVVRRLVAAMPAGAAVVVAAFDQTVTELYRGPARELGPATALLEHGALGASDVGAALDRAAAAAASGMTRVVVVGDVVPTLGERDAGKLAARLRGLGRVDVVQVGHGLDREIARAIVRAGAQPGAILDGRDPERAAHQLALALPVELPIVVEGAVKWWPTTTRNAVPGEPIVIAGHQHAAAFGLAIRIGEHRVAVAPRHATFERIQHAVARAELAELAAQATLIRDATHRVALEDRIRAVAVANNQVTPQTSLMVFESDADEERTIGRRPPAATEGVTIDGTYQRNIPTGRSFENVLITGGQGDNLGISFSGSTSLDNNYIVDGISSRARPRQQALRDTARASAFPFERRKVKKPVRSASGKPEPEEAGTPYTGVLHDVMTALARADRDGALERATRAQLANPGDVAAIIALGEALEARGAAALAARAYGSLVDLYPSRADFLRAAGNRLERAGARALAIDTYRRALVERPDQASSYRLLAYALLRRGDVAEAFEVIASGVDHANSGQRPALQRDAHLIGAALRARDPSQHAAVVGRIGIDPITGTPSVHVVLGWETDATDVDLHVRDADGEHAFHATPKLDSGGELVTDVRDGYGPEMFAVVEPRAFPYTISARYHSRGAMGTALGTVQIIRHDGNGKLTVEERPFVIQNDHATVELGTIRER